MVYFNTLFTSIIYLLRRSYTRYSKRR